MEDRSRGEIRGRGPEPEVWGCDLMQNSSGFRETGAESAWSYRRVARIRESWCAGSHRAATTCHPRCAGSRFVPDDLGGRSARGWLWGRKGGVSARAAATNVCSSPAATNARRAGAPIVPRTHGSESSQSHRSRRTPSGSCGRRKRNPWVAARNARRRSRFDTMARRSITEKTLLTI